ncbi:MAG: flagellar hook-basal body protein [Minicystis sp.]
MNNAIYSAASGLMNRSRALDVTASNLANANTAGYKRDRLLTSTFSERLAYRLEADGSRTEIGRDTHGAIVDETFTDYSQGVMDDTGRALDFAIIGDGFFSIETAGGQQASTRDGSFQVDGEGYLRTATGGYVMGQGGRIQVGAGEVIHRFRRRRDQRRPDRGHPGHPGAGPREQQPDQGVRQRDDPPGGQGAFTGRIASGKLERSNVDVGDEMAAMMAASRAFQTCAQAVRILDAISQKTVNEIGRRVAALKNSRKRLNIGIGRQAGSGGDASDQRVFTRPSRAS